MADDDSYTVRLEIVDSKGKPQFWATLAPATEAELIGPGRFTFNLLGTMDYVYKLRQLPAFFRGD